MSQNKLLDTLVHTLDKLNHFNVMDNPTVSVSNQIKIDKSISNIDLMTCVIDAVNKIENFRVRFNHFVPAKAQFIEFNHLTCYDKVDLGYTVATKDEVNTFKFAIAKYDENLDKTKDNIKTSLVEARGRESFHCDGGKRRDLIYLSCMPKMEFTNIQQPFNRLYCDVPSIIIGNNFGTISVCVQAHHGFVDGYHINLFFKHLTNNINNVIM